MGWGAPLVAALLLMAAPAPAPAQADTHAGERLRVFLMTMGPGDAVWERFGHNAIWIHDPLTVSDPAYNWGLFDFDQPGFIRRFLRGRMLYWMEGLDAELSIRHYAGLNRSVWVQELDLSPEQRLALVDFLEWNALPENREYLYDYYRDNCSTRVRDALDHVLGGELQRRLGAVPTTTTWRSESLRLVHDDLPVYTGFLLGLGRPADRPLNAWEESFIPMRLSDHLAGLSIARADGSEAPLVVATEVLFRADRTDPPARPPARTAGYLVAGLLIAALLLGSAVAGRRNRRTRAGFAVAAVTWAGLAGLFGTILVVLWAATDHSAAYRNENVLLVNPLSLAVALLLLAGLRGRRPGLLRAARAAATAAALLASLALLGQIIGLSGQWNGEMIALLLPPQLALAASLYLRYDGRTSTPEDAGPVAPAAQVASRAA
jgi:hypothetical protein